MSETDNTTGGSATGITGLEGLLVTALTQVVLSRVDNNRSANDGVWTEQLDQIVSNGTLSDTIVVRRDVTHVADVSDGVSWRAVGLLEWVEVGARGDTAVGDVAELVDVEAAQRVGRVAGDLVGDRGGLVLRRLLEVDGAGDAGGSS